jgi:hypothetical protein
VAAVLKPTVAIILRPVLETAAVLQPGNANFVPGFSRVRTVMVRQSGNDCSLVVQSTQHDQGSSGKLAFELEFVASKYNFKALLNMMGGGDYRAVVNMVGVSATHPCTKCTVKKDDIHFQDESSKKIVPTVCVTDTKRIVESNVARTVGNDNNIVTDPK